VLQQTKFRKIWGVHGGDYEDYEDEEEEKEEEDYEEKWVVVRDTTGGGGQNLS
jgi:hypothetical protein